MFNLFTNTNANIDDVAVGIDNRELKRNIRAGVAYMLIKRGSNISHALENDKKIDIDIRKDGFYFTKNGNAGVVKAKQLIQRVDKEGEYDIYKVSVAYPKGIAGMIESSSKATISKIEKLRNK